jgi:hypothetical protein
MAENEARERTRDIGKEKNEEKREDGWMVRGAGKGLE